VTEIEDEDRLSRDDEKAAARAGMRIEVVKRELNQGALAGFDSSVTEYAARLVIAALDSFDEEALKAEFRRGFDAAEVNSILLIEQERESAYRAGQEAAAGDRAGDRLWVFPMDAKVDVILPDGTHRYWSTHCRHGRHDACSATELAPGMPRKPAQCKTCQAPCVCPCHEEAP
jgi:hypothetical protein